MSTVTCINLMVKGPITPAVCAHWSFPKCHRECYSFSYVGCVDIWESSSVHTQHKKIS